MMARKWNASVVSAGAMAANITSSGVVLDFCPGYSIQAVITSSSGPVTGTLSLQGSSDDTQATPSNWTTIAGSSTAVSGNGTVMWDVDNPNYHQVRLLYVTTSGTGTLNARINYKKV